MSYNKISVVMDQFNLFGIPKVFKILNFEKIRPLSAESVTGYTYMDDNHVKIRKL